MREGEEREEGREERGEEGEEGREERGRIRERGGGKGGKGERRGGGKGEEKEERDQREGYGVWREKRCVLQSNESVLMKLVKLGMNCSTLLS